MFRSGRRAIWSRRHCSVQWRRAVALHIVNIDFELRTFTSTFTTAVDNSNSYYALTDLFFFVEFRPFWVFMCNGLECFILQGKVARLISWGGRSLYC